MTLLASESTKTILEWHEPNFSPERNSVVLISVHFGPLSDETWRVEPGSFEAEAKIFRAWRGEDCGWETIEIDKIQCWTFWPHPPGAIPAFAKELGWFEKVINNDLTKR